jgi:hypothetical protein
MNLEQTEHLLKILVSTAQGVAIGCGIFLIMVQSKLGQIRKEANKKMEVEIAQAHQATKHLDLQVAETIRANKELDLRIVEAKQANAQLSMEMERQRKENLELQKELLPRAIELGISSRVLQTMPGISVNIDCVFFPEAMRLQEQFVDLFKRSGWKVIGDFGVNANLVLDGVLIRTNENPPLEDGTEDRSKVAGLLLKQVLDLNGLACKIDTDPSTPRDTVKVWIGFQYSQLLWDKANKQLFERFFPDHAKP